MASAAREVLRISGKDLGALALDGHCARCAWIGMRHRRPWQIFPGIFSSIDAYNKRMVHAWFDRHGAPPPWLARVEAFARYHEPPHHSKFQIMDRDTAIHLTGAPDAVLERADGTLCIADYKTARFTPAQDALMPMYAVQLNAYRLIAHRLGWPEVTRLVLLYMEPVPDGAADDAMQDARGFRMTFAANAHDLPIDEPLVARMMRRARELYDDDAPPVGAPACKDCAALDAIARRLAPAPDVASGARPPAPP